MEDLGFSRSRDISFIVSGGKKKPDQDAGWFVYLGQGDEDFFPSFYFISAFTSLGMKSQSTFLELSPLLPRRRIGLLLIAEVKED